MHSSLVALQQTFKDKTDNSVSNTLRVDMSALNEAISAFQEDLIEQLASIRRSITKGHHWLINGYEIHLMTHRLLEKGWADSIDSRLLPVLTPVTLLETLRDKARGEIYGTIQAEILRYAKSIVSLQQLLRIRDAHRQQDHVQLANERRYAAHRGWKPEDHIDWLLLEIDFNLIIREDQLQVAKAMIASPSTISNFVLQMNMGRGKSSVIIPMVAAALAKDKNLVRVVVPRSLLLQAAQLLSSRLGGLINRKIKHIPFSRKSRTDLDSLKAYHELHLEVFKSRGILLSLPEHLLSFQLSGLQELSNG